MEEEWKNVSDYPDRFMISNHGRVWSKKSNRILVQGTSKSGYRVIASKIGGRNGTPICKKVHRWVATAFIENPHNKPHVNHIDGDKTNNFEWNLEWCTVSENNQHAYDTGLAVALAGVSKPNAKLTEQEVRYMKNNYNKECKQNNMVAYAKKFNIDRKVVWEIINGTKWKHVS